MGGWTANSPDACSIFNSLTPRKKKRTALPHAKEPVDEGTMEDEEGKSLEEKSQGIVGRRPDGRLAFVARNVVHPKPTSVPCSTHRRHGTKRTALPRVKEPVEEATREDEDSESLVKRSQGIVDGPTDSKRNRCPFRIQLINATAQKEPYSHMQRNL